jgi:CheY-like chemotaxis protein
MRILIADDEPVTRLLLATTVQRLGHDTIMAVDGLDAWDRCCAEKPDAVICDWTCRASPARS